MKFIKTIVKVKNILNGMNSGMKPTEIGKEANKVMFNIMFL